MNINCHELDFNCCLENCNRLFGMVELVTWPSVLSPCRERKYIHNVVIVTACRTDWHKVTMARGVK